MKLAERKPRNIEVWLSELGLPSADRDYQPGHGRVQNLIKAIAKTEALHKPILRIRVAGTNGKGSTSQFLAEALQACGLKVGLYTSPHLQRFHERICVQGQEIDDANMFGLMGKVMPLALEQQTSYFETATVLALLYFSRQHVDIEILEAGVGAKLDATTAVPADIALLTSVALDHQDWLGNTLSEITREKAFVFQGCTLSLSVEQPHEVTDILNDLQNNIVFAQRFLEPLTILGEHQQQNAGLAWAAIQAIQGMESSVSSCIDLKACKQAIQDKHIAGRLEHVVFQTNHFWLDAAHNEHAITALIPTLRSMQIFDVILLCTREDRDLSACVPSLKALTKQMVVMTGKLDYAYKSVADALSLEVTHLKGGRILVLGSFITLGATMEWIKKDVI